MSIMVHYGGKSYESDDDYETASRNLFEALGRTGKDGFVFWELVTGTGVVRISLNRTSEIAIERVDEKESTYEDRAALVL
ncbi:hypothetical protein [Clavibacter zhangzhiyongii]|uniref:hypothetical protein n=1 Tax=Clavibacter zhangzhiyongii TaxID=2768071 RepID=UPI0039DF75C2